MFKRDGNSSGLSGNDSLKNLKEPLEDSPGFTESKPDIICRRKVLMILGGATAAGALGAFALPGYDDEDCNNNDYSEYDDAEEEYADKTSALPMLSPERIGQVKSNIPKARADLVRFSEKFEQLKLNYADVFLEMEELHPKFAISLNKMEGIVDKLSSDNKSMSDEELIRFVGEYNLYAAIINNISGGYTPELSIQQKQELEKFIEEFWDKLFPDSNTNKLFKKIKGQEYIEGDQKLLLAPLNGVEDAVSGLIGIVDPKTYKDLASSGKTLRGMSCVDWSDNIVFLSNLYENLSMSNKLSPAISLLFGVGFMTIGTMELANFMNNTGLPTWLKRIIITSVSLKIITQVTVPINAMPGVSIGGIVLSYI